MDGFRQISGLWWPEQDEHCRPAVLHTLGDIDDAVRFVTRRNVCVQAGGNCGIWVVRFAELFGHVYTFEPDRDNYWCLERNCQAPNVTMFNAALGHEPGAIRMEGQRDNCGALYIAPGGEIPVMTIDSLSLEACDLIYLDIEGYEFLALQGAAQTIARHRPVIAIENKGLSERYGKTAQAVERFICTLGYEVAARIRRDVIFKPQC